MASGRQQEPAPQGAHIFLGGEPEAVRAAMEPLRRAAAQVYPPRTLVVSGETEVMAQLLDEHASGSLFAERRFSELVLPALPRARSKEEALLRRLLGALPAEDLLLVSGPAPKGGLPAWAKTAQDSPGGGSARIVWPPRPGRELAGWLRGQAKLRGLQPDEGAVNALLQNYDGNLVGLRMELDRLQLAGHEGKLTAQHLAELGAGADTALGVRELADACMRGDVAKAMRALADLQDDSHDHRMLILTTLGSKLTLLATAANAVHRGTPPQAALEGAGVWRSEMGAMDRALRRRGSPRWWDGLCARLAWIDGCARGRQLGDTDLELRNLVFAFASGRPAVPRPRLRRSG